MLEALMQHPVNRSLAAAFSAAGYPLFLVGGSVRDALSGTPDFSDLDYTTSARPEVTTSIVEHFGTLWTSGASFGTIGVQVSGVVVEVTTFRTEVYAQDSRKPEVGYGDTIADDLLRRDLTINALALCLVGDGEYNPGDLVDLFGGAADLASGVLRTPDSAVKSMSEDPLRQIRVLRFAAKRGMEISPDLAEAITSNADRLGVVSVERCNAELRKMALAGPSVLAMALELAEGFGLAEHLVGSLPVNAPALRALRRLPADAGLVESLAVLSVLGGADPVAVLRPRKFSSEEFTSVAKLASTVEKLGVSPDVLQARSLVRSESDALLDSAYRVQRAALGEVPPQTRIVAAARTDAPRLRAPLPVSGDDLVAAGLSGPAVGAALRSITQAFLASPSLTRREALQLV